MKNFILLLYPKKGIRNDFRMPQFQEGVAMKRFFSIIFTGVKYIVLTFVFLFVALLLFNMGSAYLEYFRYSNMKTLTIRYISRLPVGVNVPVALSKKTARDLPHLSAYTFVGDFAMFFDSSKKKIYFKVHRCLGLACAEFKYEITDAAMEKALFEEFYPLALSEEKRYTK